MAVLFQKSSVASLDYTVSWTNWLSGSEVIAESNWELPDDLTLEDEESTDSTATAYISGGQGGASYTVKNTITTDSTPPKTDARSFTLYIAER